VLSVWAHERPHTGKTMKAIREEFLQRFGKEAPAKGNILRLSKKTFQTGSVLDRQRSGRPKTRGAVTDMVDESLMRSPAKSTRKRSAELNVSRTTLRRVLHIDLGARAYRPMAVNELSDADMERRVQACNVLLNDFRALAQRRRVLFTDECAIYLSMRARNVYMWSKANPHFYDELKQHPPHLMMWAGVTASDVVGPYFFPAGGVTGEVYWELLENWLIPELDARGLRNTITLQQDGAPAHYALQVRETLDREFPGWIGRGGRRDWPPRSPDLTTCDNWLWSFVKERVSAQRIQTVDELRESVLAAFGAITPVMLRNASRRTWRRITLCRDNDGIHTDVIDH
jgi:hypothetical protein